MRAPSLPVAIRLALILRLLLVLGWVAITALVEIL
jgi:hypothetical protein